MTIKGYIEQEQAEGLRDDLLRECWFECHWAEVDRSFSQHLVDRLATGKLTIQRLHGIILKRRKVHRLKTGDKVMVERYSFMSAHWIKGVILELGRDFAGVPTYTVQIPGTPGRPTEKVTVADQKNLIRTVKEYDDYQASLRERRDTAYAVKAEQNKKRNVSFRLRVAEEVARYLVSSTDVIMRDGEAIPRKALVEMVANALKKAGVYSPHY